jgi:hypothetical protein
LKSKGFGEVKIAKVRKVMTMQLDMSYRKIIKQSVHTNSIVNRILRQQSSLKLFGYVKKGYRLISCDETWLGGTNYLRRSWRDK